MNLFIKKLLSRLEIVFVIVSFYLFFSSIVIQFYVCHKTQPLLSEKGFYTHLGIPIYFEDIIEITQKRDIAKVILCVKTKDSEYNFKINVDKYSEVNHFLKSNNLDLVITEP